MVPTNVLYILEMSYQANIDIAIAMHMFQISSFRKQGFLRFRVKLYAQPIPSQFQTTAKQNQLLTNCNPYNIYKPKHQPIMLPKQKKLQQVLPRSNLAMFVHKQQQPQNPDSYLDHDEESYYSRIFQSKLTQQKHKIEQCCYFRKYIDVHDIEQTQLLIRIDLFFRPQGEQKYVEAGYYEGVVHKLSGVSTFLPVNFDQFGSFRITGTYQATVLEYRFGNEMAKQGDYNSFEQYLNAATNGFRADKYLDFFNYYRTSLETELNSIQDQHLDLLKVIAPNEPYPYIKINPNQVVYNIAGHLESIHYGIKSHSMSIVPNYEDLKERAAHQISKDFLAIKAIIHQKWNQFILFMAHCLPTATDYHQDIHKAHVMERLRTHAFSHCVQKNWDWTFSRYEDSGKLYLQQAEKDKLKNKEEALWRDHFPIEGKNFFEDECKNIKIFEQIYQVQGMLLTKRSVGPTQLGKSNAQIKRLMTEDHSGPFSPRSTHFHPEHNFVKIQGQFGQIQPKQGCANTSFTIEKSLLTESGGQQQHIVIFVHGYQASRQDFILFKSCLEIRYNCRVFISSTNEGRTDDSIQVMGKKLAIELNNFFKTVQFGPKTRISFIGHSMGGIIIRSALSYIKNLEPYLYTYMSFSSPHVGYLYQPSALVQAGLWLLNAWNKVESLNELCMRDSSDLRKSLLYRLSENGSLKGFQKLALLSSSQDEYVPYQSARIEKDNILLDKLSYPNKPIIKQMIDNLLGEINAQELSRMNVVFNIEESNFDSWVGRTAHVKYLSDQKFIKMFCLVFEKFFI